MRKRSSLYFILFLVLAVAGIAAANYGWQHRCQDGASQSSCSEKHGGMEICLVRCGDLPCPKMVLHAKAELELTDDQTTQIKALKLALKKEKVKIKADIKILELEVGELLDKKEVDKAAVDAKVDEIAKLSAQCTKSCIQANLETKALLNDEQLKKIESLGPGAKGCCPKKAADAGPVAAAEPRCPKSK